MIPAYMAGIWKFCCAAVDQVAEAGLGADHLGGDQHEDRRGAGQPDAGEDRRHRGRQHHLREQLQRAQAQRPGGLEQQRVDRADAA